MPNTTFNFASAISLTRFQPAFRKHAEMYSWDWQQLADIQSSSTATQQIFGWYGLPAAQERGQLEGSYWADMGELDPITLTASKYSIAHTFSDELLTDNVNIKNLMGDAGQAAGESHAATVDMVVAQIFNRATNSSYPMYDGVEMCGTHTLKSGDSLVNLMATPSSISHSSVWDTVDYFMTSLRNQAGLYMADEPFAILTHTSNLQAARKVVEAPGEPDTANPNNPNTLKNFNLKIITCRYLTSTTGWFLIGRRFIKDLKFFWVWKKRTKQYPDNDLGGVKVKTEQRYMVGVRDFLNIVYNPGV